MVVVRVLFFPSEVDELEDDHPLLDHHEPPLDHVHVLVGHQSLDEGADCDGQLSQASPYPSLSVSVCVVLGTSGQLSELSSTPSISSSIIDPLVHALVSIVQDAVHESDHPQNP